MELGQNIRVAAVTMGGAIALTDTELVMGRAGFLGFGKRLERYPLHGIKVIRFHPNPSANLLSLSLGNDQPEITLLFRPGQEQEVGEVVHRLQAGNGSRAHS
jgi:hypothetical protein